MSRSMYVSTSFFLTARWYSIAGSTIVCLSVDESMTVWVVSTFGYDE